MLAIGRARAGPMPVLSSAKMTYASTASRYVSFRLWHGFLYDALLRKRFITKCALMPKIRYRCVIWLSRWIIFIKHHGLTAELSKDASKRNILTKCFCHDARSWHFDTFRRRYFLANDLYSSNGEIFLMAGFSAVAIIRRLIIAGYFAHDNWLLEMPVTHTILDMPPFILLCCITQHDAPAWEKLMKRCSFAFWRF